MTHLTKLELKALKELAKSNPDRIRLVRATGLVTCDGYAVELINKDGHFLGVIHPKAAIDMLLGDL